MKIIYIAPLNSIHTLRWINYVSEDKNFKVICLSRFYEENIVKSLNPKIKFFIVNALSNTINIFKIFKIIRSKDAGIIHVHYLGINSLFILFANKKKKIIITPWGSDIYINKNNILKKLFIKYIVNKSDFIISDSLKLNETSQSIASTKKESMVINFGTDTKKYKSRREIFNNKDNLIYIGTNRAMENIYDPFTFLKSALELTKLDSKFRFFMAHDGTLREEILNFIITNNLESKVSLVGKIYGDSNIDFYNSLDIYVSASLSDGGLSASIAEAMSCQRLVIVANNSDNYKYIYNGENGYLFENRNYLELSKKIYRASNDLIKSREIAKRSREIIKHKFYYHKEMNKVKEVYLKL